MCCVQQLQWRKNGLGVFQRANRGHKGGAIVKPDNRITRSMIAESHERQFNGQDWQAVAVDIWQALENGTEDEFNELATSPDPGCDCGFCETADWQDDFDRLCQVEITGEERP